MKLYELNQLYLFRILHMANIVRYIDSLVQDCSIATGLAMGDTAVLQLSRRYNIFLRGYCGIIADNGGGYVQWCTKSL